MGVGDRGTSKDYDIKCAENSNSEMWYYHLAKNKCFKLNYLGCGGNSNRFCLKEDCRTTCIKDPSFLNRYPIRAYHRV